MSDGHYLPDDYSGELVGWQTLRLQYTDREATSDLMKLYSHAAQWHTPEYEKLDPNERAKFAAMVKSKRAAEVKVLITECCLALDVPLNDRLVGDMSLVHLRPDQPAGKEYKLHLVEMHELAWAALLRLGVKHGLGQQLTSGTDWKGFAAGFGVGPWAAGCFYYGPIKVIGINLVRRWPLLRALWDFKTGEPSMPRDVREVWEEVWGSEPYSRAKLADVMSETTEQFARPENAVPGWAISVEFTAPRSTLVVLIITRPRIEDGSGKRS